VDWVEDVAIVTASLIVQERQFNTLNEKKEKRGVGAIRDCVEHIIDVKVRDIKQISTLLTVNS